ncbi:HAD hydrolase family protein, partial [Bacillus cereus group sp. N8]
NAIPKLKDAAYFITDTNDKDGVAQVLEKLICTVNNS